MEASDLKYLGNGDHTIIMGDAIVALNTIEDNSIDLIFADPPYNIGKNFNGYKDKWSKDVRDLSFLAEDSIDLIVTHPPYMNIIKYSDGQIAEDISNISSMPKFCVEMEKIARELYRVLKPNRYCAILLGDTRKGKHYVPLAFNVMLQFLQAGFILKEDIIKVQHNCQMTNRWLWKAKQEGFYLIMHEHLYVFRKRQEAEDVSRLKMSTAEVYE